VPSSSLLPVLVPKRSQNEKLQKRITLQLPRKFL